MIYHYFIIFWFKLALAQGQQKPMNTETVQSYLSNLPQMSTLVSLLNRNTWIQSDLEGLKNITFFAPNNDALAASQLDMDLLKYHILNKPCFDWKECQPIEETIRNGSFIKLSYNNNNNKMVESGMLHSATVIESHQLGHSNIASDITLLLSSIPYYHTVLTRPVDLVQTLTQCGWTSARDMFEEAGISTIQNNALNSQITLFVPTNQAFGTVDPKTLGKDVNQLLANLLVLKGIKTSDQWQNQSTIETLNHSNNLTLIKNGSDWEVTKLPSMARIVNTDVLFENGVMHIIDQ
ncbi:hypothetical protein K501DRAFT_339163, partial [Backusella circina FSU 941]